MQQLLLPLPTLTVRHIAETVRLSPCVTCCAMMRAALSSRHASTSSSMHCSQSRCNNTRPRTTTKLAGQLQLECAQHATPAL